MTFETSEEVTLRETLPPRNLRNCVLFLRRRVFRTDATARSEPISIDRLSRMIRRSFVAEFTISDGYFFVPMRACIPLLELFLGVRVRVRVRVRDRVRPIA